MTQTRIVTAVGTASSGQNKALSAVLEKAMCDAVTQAMAEGISDPAVHLVRKIEAREQAKRQFLSQSEPSTGDGTI